jgi:carbamoyl-phosphate synthase large subunit
LKFLLKTPTEDRIFAIYDSLKRGFILNEIAELSSIDPFFIKKIEKIVSFETKLQKDLEGNLRDAKRLGFSDEQIAQLTGRSRSDINDLRREKRIIPTYKMVDTCAAEFEAKTPYFYSTYEDECELKSSNRKKVLIIGSGPIRIGQGIEFDYCTVHAVKALKEEGIEAQIINNNPETVSTDYDTSDKLFFEPLTIEDVMNVIEKEHHEGLMVQFGGQTSVNLAAPLKRELERIGSKTAILGTDPERIDAAEDRERFSKVLLQLNIPQAESGYATSIDGAKEAASRIGFPVLVRPSYVLGGRAMQIVYDIKDLIRYMHEAVRVSKEKPILIDKFLEKAIEVDIDAVSDGEEVLIGAIMEHIEEAGVHSGDSSCVIPPQSLSKELIEKIKDYVRKIAISLKIKGLLNIQMAIKDDVVYVLEVNPRSSRTIPYVAKATGIQLSKLATKVMLGHQLRDLGVMEREVGHAAVKEVVLPFSKLKGVDTILEPEMKSTGEVMGINGRFDKAFYKAELAAYNPLPTDSNSTVFVSVCDEDKEGVVEVARKLQEVGISIVGTDGTVNYLRQRGVEARKLKKIQEGSPNVLEMMHAQKVNLVINTLTGKQSSKDSYQIRRSCIDLGIPYLTTIPAAKAAASAIAKMNESQGTIEVKSINEYFAV